MAKAKQRHSRNESASSPSGGSKGRVGTAQRRPSDDDDSTPPPPPPEMSGRSWLYWFYNERQGISWVLGCIVVAISLGFGVGTGFMTGELGLGLAQKPWRVALGASIRSSAAYQVLTLQKMPWEPIFSAWNSAKSLGHSPDNSTKNLREDPSNPRVFAVLREAIVRENGGYVHYDLGFLVPAPCGASRGIGMVRSIYTNCQKNCMPGIAKEKLAVKGNSNATDHMNTHSLPTTNFMQEEVLIRVPLTYQMTRKAALDVLLPLIPADTIRKAPLNDLDDAAILVLFLAHERGVGRTSRWLPYIASLPLEPSCGYSKSLRPYMLDAINALGEEVGLEVNGWPEELWKATQYADRIANGLARDYGLYLKTPEGITTVDNIKWALCQVASRATGGSQKHGALRMVPVLDLINHDANAGGFVELTGTERLENGNFIDATEADSGTFVVRSLRHGRRKPLRKGQELLANYNVPHYTPLDWLVSVGFVPPERWHPWEMVESALPRIRRDGPYAENARTSPSRSWQDESPSTFQSTASSYSEALL